MVVPVPGCHSGRRDGDAGHDAADDEVRRDVPVLEPVGGGSGFHRGARVVSGRGAGRRLRQGDADAGIRAARDEVHDIRLRAGPRRRPRHAPRARRRRQDLARGDGAQLLDHPAAAGGGRLEQCPGHAALRPDGARRRQAAGRQAVRSEGGAAERRVPQVPIGKDETYGMGLMVNTTYGFPWCITAATWSAFTAT